MNAQSNENISRMTIGSNMVYLGPGVGGEGDEYYNGYGIEISSPIRLTKNSKHSMMCFVDLGVGSIYEYTNTQNKRSIMLSANLSLNYRYRVDKYYMFVGPRSGIMYTKHYTFHGPIGINLGFGRIINNMSVGLILYGQGNNGAYGEGYFGFGFQFFKWK